MIRDEKYRKVMQRVESALQNCSRQAPIGSKKFKR